MTATSAVANVPSPVSLRPDDRNESDRNESEDDWDVETASSTSSPDDNAVGLLTDRANFSQGTAEGTQEAIDDWEGEDAIGSSPVEAPDSRRVASRTVSDIVQNYLDIIEDDGVA